jgi:hypothetical protein
MLAVLAGVVLLTSCFGGICCPPCPPSAAFDKMYIANVPPALSRRLILMGHGVAAEILEER